MPDENEPTMTSDDLRARVVSLEHWRIQLEIANARAEAERKHLDQRFDAVEAQIGEINGSIKWAVRIVLGALLLAFITFALRGGLNLPTV